MSFERETVVLASWLLTPMIIFDVTDSGDEVPAATLWSVVWICVCACLSSASHWFHIMIYGDWIVTPPVKL